MPQPGAGFNGVITCKDLASGCSCSQQAAVGQVRDVGQRRRSVGGGTAGGTRATAQVLCQRIVVQTLQHETRGQRALTGTADGAGDPQDQVESPPPHKADLKH